MYPAAGDELPFHGGRSRDSRAGRPSPADRTGSSCESQWLHAHVSLPQTRAQSHSSSSNCLLQITASCCSTDSKRPHHHRHPLNKAENIDCRSRQMLPVLTMGWEMPPKLAIPLRHLVPTQSGPDLRGRQTGQLPRGLHKKPVKKIIT